MKERNSRIPLFVSLGTAIGLLAVVFWHVDLALFKDAVKQTTPEILSISLLFMAGQSVLLALRWHLLVKTDQPHAHLSSSLHATFLAQAVGATFIGGGISGLIARTGLALRQGMNIDRAVSASVCDRVLTLGVLLLMAFAAFPFVFDRLNTVVHFETSLIKTAVALIVVALVLIGLTTVMVVLPRLLQRNLMLLSAFNYLRRIARIKTLPAVLVLSIAAQTFYFCAVFVLLSTHAAFSPAYFFLLMPWITLLSSIPVSFGAWGVREVSFVVGFGLLGIPAEQALLTGILTGILSLVNVLILALPMIVDPRTRSLIDDISRQTRDLLQRYRREDGVRQPR